MNKRNEDIPLEFVENVSNFDWVQLADATIEKKTTHALQCTLSSLVLSICLFTSA